MNTLNTLTACILLAALGLTGCRNDNYSVSQPHASEVIEQQQSSIVGNITDTSGNPLAGAEVQIGKRSVTTDGSGAYSLSLDDVKSAAVALVKKSGYLTMGREFRMAPKRSHNLDISLSPDQIVTAFSASAGVTELQISGAQVTIPADAIINADGSNYTGTVDIAANYYNPDSIKGARSFTQPFAGQDADGSNQTSLVTVGVIDIKLTEPDTGAELDLKDGSMATLVYPEASTDQDLPSIPLWYYDEEQTIWVKDGIAIRQADGSYKGEVSHFTLWNLDIPVNKYDAFIEGCVIDARTKQPITEEFESKIVGRGYFNIFEAHQEGKFSLNVPFNTPLMMSEYNSTVTFDPIEISALRMGETYQVNDSECIEVSVIDSDNVVDLNDHVANVFDELPPEPTAATENETMLIGYEVNLDVAFLDKNNATTLEDVTIVTKAFTSNTVQFLVDRLVSDEIDERSQPYLDVINQPRILTSQGLSQAQIETDIGDKSKYEFLNATFNNNQLIQSLDNGLILTLTLADTSLSGRKIGDVLSNQFYEGTNNPIVNELNNLPSSLSVFDNDASCKVMISDEANMDYIDINAIGYNRGFDNQVSFFYNPIQDTWADIPWAARMERNKLGVSKALVSKDNQVFEAEYYWADFIGLSEAEKNECYAYNEAAKAQILAAIQTAYPTL